MRAYAILLALCVMFAPAAVKATLVLQQAMSLPAIVDKSDTIVVVAPSKARSRAIKVRRRYERVQSPWEVVEVLRGSPALVGQNIYVDVYNWRFEMGMAESRRPDHPMPSIVAPQYHPLDKIPVDPSPEHRILFLHKEDDDAYEPTAIDAVESVKAVDKVRAAVKALPR